jgi:hypothetical protein
MTPFLPIAVCARCGLNFYGDRCAHANTERYNISDAHAARIRAAYSFGKRFNPDHDTTSYYDQTADENLKGVAYAEPDPKTAAHADTAVGSRLPHAPEPKDL